MSTKKLLCPFLLILALTFTSCSNNEASSEETAIALKSYQYSSTELDLMDRINQHRSSIGLAVLQQIEHVSFKAYEHNLFMIDNNQVSHHNFNQRSQHLRQTLPASRVGENLAFNFQSNSGVLNAWLASDGHAKNIEGDFTHFGISISTDNNGRKYYTNIFIKK
jgi:uncharacterized protein YkwD